ncbi:trypsin-3 [Xenopus laevis]|uniref:Trypsin-3 n=2 Tax=Xenopus laevis TaxID=8355 RepID=A0A8J1L650_XENLA|nr:trypsin-3 [Xenopus laevis]
MERNQLFKFPALCKSYGFIRYYFLPAAAPLDESRIVGGYECAPHSQPWQVHLTYKGNFFCGGSLIAPRWIVSAAHCYMLPRYVVANIGMHNVSMTEGTVQRIQVEKAFQHYKYNSNNIDNDFMLIKLVEPAQFNQYVQPIPLAHSCPRNGTQCVVSGYGNMRPGLFGEFPDRLQCLNVPVLPEQSCKASYGDGITNSMFCAGFQEGGKDSCQGDSGGPLVCDGELSGVVSWGKGCADKGFPGVYTKVCNYIDWVNDITEEN